MALKYKKRSAKSILQWRYTAASFYLKLCSMAEKSEMEGVCELAIIGPESKTGE